MKSAYIVITHNPDEGFTAYIESLISEGASQIVIVDDAGDEEYEPIFNQLSSYPGCTVLSFNEAREDAVSKALTWCNEHLAPFGYTDVMSVAYENETQRRAAVEKAAAKALCAKEVMGKTVGFRGAYESVMDKIAGCREVLKIWRPMRMRRAVSA